MHSFCSLPRQVPAWNCVRLALSGSLLAFRRAVVGRGAFFLAGWASPSARIWTLGLASLGLLRPVRLAAALLSQAPIVRLALLGGRYSETGNRGQVSEPDFESSSGWLPSMHGKRLLPVASWCQVAGDWWPAQVGTRLTILRESISDVLEVVFRGVAPRGQLSSDHSALCWTRPSGFLQLLAECLKAQS